MGPLLSSLAIFSLATWIQSDLNLWRNDAVSVMVERLSIVSVTVSATVVTARVVSAVAETNFAL
jgi:hypothetical protein